MRGVPNGIIRLLVIWRTLTLLTYREGEDGSWNRTVETRSNKTFQYIDGLNPYTVYLFRVAAENALGYSKPGKESYRTMTLRDRKLNQLDT